MDEKTIADGHLLYVICLRDHAYAQIGPFANYDVLRVWADAEEKNGDDPRWQSIELPADVASSGPQLHTSSWHFERDQQTYR